MYMLVQVRHKTRRKGSQQGRKRGGLRYEFNMDGLLNVDGGGVQDRWIRVDVDPRVVKGPTFASSTAPGTIFHDTVKPIFFGQDLLGAVVPEVIRTGIAVTVSEIAVVLAQLWEKQTCKTKSGDGVNRTQA